MKKVTLYLIILILTSVQITIAAEQSNCASDLYFDKQWNLTNSQTGINFCEAKSITQGNNNIKIAIIGDGVFEGHSDLIVNERYSIDENNNYGINYKYGLMSTKLAGIVNATPDNGGICGIAPNCDLISIAISSPSPEAYAAAFQYAILRNADVILCTWTCSNFTIPFELEYAIEDALHNGRNGKGIVVVWPSGDSYNSATLADESVKYPANSNDDILVVGAINKNGKRPSKFYGTENWSSGFGEQLDVVAPGVNIPATSYVNQNGFDIESYDFNYSSTSSAAAHVAAIAGLLLSVNPNLTNIEVNNIIEKTARKVGNYSYGTHPNHSNGDWNIEMGYGLVDAGKSLQELSGIGYIQNKTYQSDSPSPNIKDTVIAGYAVTDTQPYGNVIVQDGSNITFRARNRIELRPGFRVEQGASFKAIIESPSQVPTAPSHVRKKETYPTNSNNGNADVVQRNVDAFSVSPNPVVSTLRVKTLEEFSQVKIYSLNGQCVLQSAQTDIDVSALPQGMYILRVLTTDGQEHQAKFIKQ